MAKPWFLKESSIGMEATKSLLPNPSMLGKTLDFAFTNPVGLAATGIAFGGADEFLSAAGPKSMARAQPGVKTPTSLEDINNLNKIGSASMTRTLKDVLVDKIRGAHVKTANATTPSPLGVSVTAKDAAFVTKIATEFTNTEKHAGLKSFLGNEGLQSAVMALNLIGMAGMGGMALGHVYDKGNDALKRRDAYKQMFEEFPNLNEIPREQVDKYWTVLKDFAPKLTTNPLVAGQFIENMATYGMKGIDHNVVGQLAQISNSLNQAGGGAEALKALSGLGTKSFDSNMRGMSELEGIGRSGGMGSPSPMAGML